ncbi:hypothetical protein [Helicobacter macacae]|nr:hypothetical protein [Helicobacter macacae]
MSKDDFADNAMIFRHYEAWLSVGLCYKITRQTTKIQKLRYNFA